MNILASNTTTLAGTVTVPASKSQTIRGLVVATLAEGKSILKNALVSDDITAARHACEALGATIAEDGADLIVESTSVPLARATEAMHTGNSGITTRFIMPAIGLRAETDTSMTIDCSEQMRQRPVQPLIDALSALGMNISGTHCPLTVTGSLTGGQVTIDGESSQYLSALLLNLPCASGDSVIDVPNLQEKPYVDMTLRWLREQSVAYRHEEDGNIDRYHITGGHRYQQFTKMIPGDFSSASYLIAAGVMWPGRVELHGLDMDDPQPDKQLIEILKDMGARIEYENGVLTIEGGGKLSGREIDCNDIPDMLPTIAVVGTYAEGETRLTNVAHARIKETDRIVSMAEGLRKMGAEIEERDDGLVIKKSQLTGAQVHGYHDHRTIMALSLAGLMAKGETIIDTAEGINKTFPTFARLMQSLGANITLQE